MKIAKIVSSNSHIDYVARVIDELDTNLPPSAADYGFAQFVVMPVADDEVFGIIYDSKLINPEYANYGPRLSPKPSLANFSPDYISEQGILVGILLIGVTGQNGASVHGMPRVIVPAGQDVFAAEPAKLRKFHTDANGRLQIHYYSQVIVHAGPFAVPLLESIIDGLTADCSPEDAQRLGVLKQSLAWQRTFGGNRL